MAREPDPQLARGLALALVELERRGISQKDLAERFGVEPATVSRWKTGDRSFALSILPTIDHLCDQPKGYVLRLAGYVEDPESFDVVSAIEADTGLRPAFKLVLIDTYTSMREQAKARA